MVGEWRVADMILTVQISAIGIVSLKSDIAQKFI